MRDCPEVEAFSFWDGEIPFVLLSTEKTAEQGASTPPTNSDTSSSTVRSRCHTAHRPRRKRTGSLPQAPSLNDPSAYGPDIPVPLAVPNPGGAAVTGVQMCAMS
jgi:hypothetical protein